MMTLIFKDCSYLDNGRTPEANKDDRVLLLVKPDSKWVAKCNSVCNPLFSMNIELFVVTGTTLTGSEYTSYMVWGHWISSDLVQFICYGMQT